MAESKREKQRSFWRRESENGRKEKDGPSNGNKLRPTKSGLDSKTGERLNSKLVWDPHKIQDGISIFI